MHFEMCARPAPAAEAALHDRQIENAIVEVPEKCELNCELAWWPLSSFC